MQVHLHVFKTTRMFPSEPKSQLNMNIDMRHVLVLSAHAGFLQRNRCRFTKDNIIKNFRIWLQSDMQDLRAITKDMQKSLRFWFNMRFKRFKVRLVCILYSNYSYSL